MKKLAIILLFGVFLSSCKDKTLFVINGTFENAPNGGMVYFYGTDSGDVAYRDSSVLSEKGAFMFKHPAPKSSFYSIVYNGKNYVVIAQNGDEIDFKANFNDEKMGYEVDGGAASEKLMAFNKVKDKYETEIGKINIDFNNRVMADPTKKEAIAQEFSKLYDGQLDEINQVMFKYANDNTDSALGEYAYNFFTIKEGLHAPDFTLPSIDGKKISLSDFKGKYVLLDVWASWCVPCRQENPNVVKAYNAFKDKNFTVFSVSIDKDREAWKNAVKADNLTWSHASDLGDWLSKVVKLYKLNSIPASFLIDPQGKIIARDLRGDDLQKFLSATLR